MKLTEIRQLARRLRYDGTPVTDVEIGEAARAIRDLLDLLDKIELCNIFKDPASEGLSEEEMIRRSENDE